MKLTHPLIPHLELANGPFARHGLFNRCNSKGDFKPGSVIVKDELHLEGFRAGLPLSGAKLDFGGRSRAVEIQRWGLIGGCDERSESQKMGHPQR